MEFRGGISNRSLFYFVAFLVLSTLFGILFAYRYVLFFALFFFLPGQIIILPFYKYRLTDEGFRWKSPFGKVWHGINYPEIAEVREVKISWWLELFTGTPQRYVTVRKEGSYDEVPIYTPAYLTDEVLDILRSKCG
ncbi:MAG: hypothetical protein ACPF8V_08450 [Luteibaculum sp.]